MTRSPQNCPDLEMSLQSIPAIFATDAGLLESTEGRQRRMRRAVDHYATEFQLLGDAMRVPQIGALNISLQAVRTVVGDCDGFGFIVVGNDAQYRAEDLFTRDPHRVVDAGEDGGLYEPSAIQTCRAAFAADQHMSALLDAYANIILYAIPLLLADHRPDIDGGIG